MRRRSRQPELVLEQNAHDPSHWTTGTSVVFVTWVFVTSRQTFHATLRSQNTRIPVTTTSTIVLTPAADPPGQIGGTGQYNSPRGYTSDFVTTGHATINTIDATFDGIDCDDGSGVRLPSSGHIRVTK